jgi:tRNA nucleotidyltransferase/poly(A) polymerase
LLGLPVKDEDVLVTGVAWPLLERILYGVGRVDAVGVHFGVLKVSRDGVTVDVALPRTERSTGVGHRDFEVMYDPALTVESDLARRDFTVNAIARNIASGELVDPFGGAADLERRELRAVGSARDRFAEDPLRMLRAARFLAKLDFTIEAQTFVAAQDEADAILTVASERIQSELWGLLEANHADGVLRALRFLRDAGLLERIVPEFAPSIGLDQQNPHHFLPLDEHVFQAIRYAVAHDAPTLTRLALLLHDIAKPATQSFDSEGIAHYYGHEVVGADMARVILERLKFPGDVLERACKIVRHHMRPPKVVRDRSLRRFVNELGDDWLAGLACREADLFAHVLEPGFDTRSWAAALQARAETFSAELASFDERSLAVSGVRLMQEFAVPPGPELGRLKKLAAQAVVDGELENEESAVLEWLARIAPRTR